MSSGRIRSPAGNAGMSLADAVTAAIRTFHAGRLVEAETRCQQILDAVPGQPDALHLLGLIAQQSGQTESAIALLEQAIAGNARFPVFRYHLGEIHRVTGNLEEAERRYRETLELQGDYADAMFGLAGVLAQTERPEEAVELYRKGIALQPGDPLILCELGETLMTAGRPSEAVACFREAEPAMPGSPELSVALGIALYRSGDLAGAVESLRRAWDTDPGRTDVRNLLAGALQESGAIEEASEHYRAILALEPEHAEALTGLGVCLQQLGRFEEAREHHEQALALKPSLAGAHFNLALGRAGGEAEEADEREVERLTALLDDPSLAAKDRAQLCFALGRILEGLGRYDEAFVRYDAGNAPGASDTPFDIDSYRRFVDRQIEVFSSDLFAAHEASGPDSELPVLIVGMPRSGTTLIEQIVASHPRAAGGGELRVLGEIADGLAAMLGSDREFPECAAGMTPDAARRCAERYLAALASVSTDADRVTDKLPNNYLRLGLLALVAPKARVIHCVRDPLDTCLSCFFHPFTLDPDYTADLRTLGFYYREYERLMEHWRTVLPLPVLDVVYENLVAEPEAGIREIIGFCGLDWDDACLDFHTHERPIQTFSFRQARQPVYTASVGRWRNYEKHLGPLREALGR